MLKWISAATLAVFLTFAFVAPTWASHNPMRYYRAQPAFPKHKNNVVTLRYMPGGQVGIHLIHAKVWADFGRRVVIADDQYSAAAMMVVHFKDRGGKACFKRGAGLHFHLLANGIHPSAVIGHRKTIGKLTHRFKEISPAAFGIPRC